MRGVHGIANGGACLRHQDRDRQTDRRLDGQTDRQIDQISSVHKNKTNRSNDSKGWNAIIHVAKPLCRRLR